MNLGSRYQPKNYRRPSRKRRRRRPSKKQKKRRPTKRRPTKIPTKRRPSKKRGASRPRRKEEKRRLKVSDIMFEIHRSLMSKPDPEIIPTVENTEFFQGTPGPHLVRYSTSARYEKYSIIHLVRPIIHLVRIFALSTS